MPSKILFILIGLSAIALIVLVGIGVWQQYLQLPQVNSAPTPIPTRITKIDFDDLATRQAQTVPYSQQTAPDPAERIVPKIMVFDLRDPSEYQTGHLPNALNLPREVIERGNYALPQKDIKVVLYGNTEDIADIQSLQKSLTSKGVVEIEIVTEPYNNWTESFEVETDSPKGE